MNMLLSAATDVKENPALIILGPLKWMFTTGYFKLLGTLVVIQLSLIIAGPIVILVLIGVILVLIGALIVSESPKKRKLRLMKEIEESSVKNIPIRRGT